MAIAFSWVDEESDDEGTYQFDHVDDVQVTSSDGYVLVNVPGVGQSTTMLLIANDKDGIVTGIKATLDDMIDDDEIDDILTALDEFVAKLK